MNKLKCIVIDDDPMMSDLIHHFCDKLEDIAYCITCNDAISGLKMLSSESFNLVFLDYNMPEISGKGILEMKADESKVIMITSHADFAVESYSFDSIIDYILKPVTFERFSEAVNKYLKLRNIPQNIPAPSNEILYLKDGRKWIPINKSSILYIKSDSNYARIITEDKSILSLAKLKDLENDLPNYFIRVHRSYIININFIDYFTTEIVSVGGEEIPISNKYKDQVLKIILRE